MRAQEGRQTKKRTAGSSSRAERNIVWCEEYCFLPEGKDVGKALKLAEFQRMDFKAIYDNPYGETRRAIISRARKNAKSATCAFILLLHLCGPEAKVNSQIYSCAQSRDQAGILFNLAAKCIRMSPRLREVVEVKESAKELHCRELGTKYKALSAEASTALGLSPALVLFDELGQCRGPRSILFENMATATAAQENPLTIIISTQAATDADLLSILIDDAQGGHDPSVVLRLDTAPDDLDPFSEESIRAANPGYDIFMNKREVLKMADDARRMPARQNQYFNLILNRRVDVSTPFITPELWKACSTEPLDLDGREVFAGLDLSETADLTALVLIGLDPTDGSWSVRPTFWLPAEKLREKAQVDRIPYDLWARQGYLQTTPGATISYEYVAQYLKEEIFDRHNVQKVGFDRWNMTHLSPWLLKAGLSEEMIKEKFHPFGMGFKDMSPALRDLEAVILEKKLRHGNHPVLTMCMGNAVIERDPAGNRKLNKKRSTGRIDGSVALVMALAAAPQKTAQIDISTLIG